VQVLAHGQLVGRMEPPMDATRVEAWTGMVSGWLSGGLTSKVDLELPPGEVVLYLPVRGESTEGISPILHMTLAGHELPRPVISEQGWRTTYILLSTGGG